MYTQLNGITVGVSTFGSGDATNITTIVFLGQTDIMNVVSNIGTELRLYEDEQLTTLAAIFNQVEIQRATIDMVAHNVSVTISASRLSELETEQMKQDIVNQQNAMDDSDSALVELAQMVEDNMNAIVELGDLVAHLQEEIEALKPTPEPEATEEVVNNG